MIPNKEHDGTKNTDKHIEHRSQLIFVTFAQQMISLCAVQKSNVER